MTYAFPVRALSAFAIATILSAHFISAVGHSGQNEIYMVCAVSYFISFLWLLSGTAGSALIVICFSGLALIFLALSIAAMAIGVFASLILCGALLLIGSRGRSLMSITAFFLNILALTIYVGLVLMWLNHFYSNVGGTDKIYLSPFYIVVPLLLSATGTAYFFCIENTNCQPKSSPRRA